ncbi:MAG: hypothetical protein ACLFTR_05580 [Candidatus Woesearchaeota archaeon]
MAWKEDNQEERMRFIKRWAEYVRTHDDKDWSRQQNIIIDSQIKNNKMKREEYLKMKNESFKSA